LDALKHGFEVYILKDAIKGINPGDEEKALKELKEKGAKIITL
ncbi:MAG TPA: isochorismatase family protein, partial [Thermococcus paralvinellae]|nr:isochorismatase family protein [Thermococcus paralvinellae]